MEIPALSPLSSKVALFIDGENISANLAGKIIVAAGQKGDLAVKRVYGSFASNSGWRRTAGLRLIHTDSGKNSADMLMVIEAMDFAHKNVFDTFVIASSDGDFSHLAYFLREMGKTVIGIGEGKAPDRFRKACSVFVEVGKAKKIEKDASTLTAKMPPEENDVNQKIAQLLKTSPKETGMEIAVLGGKMHSKYKVKISTLPEKNWRAYLLKRANLFDCDPRGKGACVRLK